MQVILLKDQRNLGRRGQEVAVKPGYGRNFLIPQGVALPATRANKALFEQQRHKIDARHTRERDAAAEVAATISGLRITITKRVGETGTLYGSVTSMEIAAALEAKGITIDRRKIELEAGLKSLGDHKVEIDLHPEVMAELTVTVVAEE